jgi:hypothetical protein
MIRLVKTCSACPEQYDAYHGDDRVGYLRLRHGEFRVDAPDCGGLTIYRATPLGDGEFEDHERDYYLRFAVKAIEDWMAAGWPMELSPPPAPDVQYEVTP